MDKIRAENVVKCNGIVALYKLYQLCIQYVII